MKMNRLEQIYEQTKLLNFVSEDSKTSSHYRALGAYLDEACELRAKIEKAYEDKQQQGLEQLGQDFERLDYLNTLLGTILKEMAWLEHLETITRNLKQKNEIFSENA